MIVSLKLLSGNQREEKKKAKTYRLPEEISGSDGTAG
jgi:hypothetical protein